MSNFVQTMKDWRRLCRAMATDEGCNDCPLLHISPDERGCEAICYDEYADNVDWSKLEETVDKWAAENPAPVYPTLIEWLRSIGLADHRMIDPIPADIAEKLGLKPKEE